MKKLLVLLLALLLLTTNTWAQTTEIESLSWMSGHWIAGSQEEHWSSVKGKTVMGYHRDFKDGATSFFEFLRIEEDGEGKITYWASPKGSSWTPFALTSTDKKTALFSNPEHNFPKEIRYRREGKMMHVEISDGGSKRMRWSWRLSKP